MDSIGTRLRLERKRLGLTQASFAEIGGVATNAQAHYESGHRKPRTDYLFRLAVEGVNISFVVTGSDPQPSVAKRLAASEAISRKGSFPQRVIPHREAKIIEHLHQSLWDIASALADVYNLIDHNDPRTAADHVKEYFEKAELQRMTR